MCSCPSWKFLERWVGAEDMIWTRPGLEPFCAAWRWMVFSKPIPSANTASVRLTRPKSILKKPSKSRVLHSGTLLSSNWRTSRETRASLPLSRRLDGWVLCPAPSDFRKTTAGGPLRFWPQAQNRFPSAHQFCASKSSPAPFPMRGRYPGDGCAPRRSRRSGS